jgi:hypothetical protein
MIDAGRIRFIKKGDNNEKKSIFIAFSMYFLSYKVTTQALVG